MLYPSVRVHVSVRCVWIFSLAVFEEETLRYCHSPGGVVSFRCRAKTLTFSNISIITEDIYLKLRVDVHYQKGNPYQ